jgi:uncharacterized protein (DUF2235 family)
MTKRLVICCDGTWNTPDQMNGGTAAPTNVVKVALAVAPVGADGREQRVYYHRGLGTSRWERIRGGAFGFGLSRDVRDCYRFLVHHYEPGDELFFFGFSRGAYTARSTVGFVRNCGILRPEHADRVDEAYSLYRSRRPGTRPKSVEAQLFRRSYSHETRIRFLGVWDTVGALGIPLSGLRLVNLVNRRWQFHDTALSSSIDSAFHALAIDERRGPFRPTLWNAPDGASGQHREQVWFAGSHSDVGGGCPDPALAEIPLLWLADRARGRGLTFAEDAFARRTDGDEPDLRNLGKVVAPDPFGRLHESRFGPYRLLPPYVRSIGKADSANEFAATAAVARQDTDGYEAPNLADYLRADAQVMPVSLDFQSRPARPAVAVGAP